MSNEVIWMRDWMKMVKTKVEVIKIIVAKL